MTTTSNNDDNIQPPQRRRKLRVLVISMPDSERREHIVAMFHHPKLMETFEQPQFSDGVPQRSLRNRYTFLETCHRAGLIPEVEWQAIKNKQEEIIQNGTTNTDNFFDCLNDIPINTNERRGSANDIKLHYSVELWRKAKTINRGRSVLGCTLAHLIALQRFTTEGFDVMLEDNIRTTITVDAAERIWKAKEASESEEEDQINGNNNDNDDSGPCHLRFLGWLGSIPNLEWILTRHVPQKAIRRQPQQQDGGSQEKDNNDDDGDTSFSVVPFPKTQDIMADLEENAELEGISSADENDKQQEQQAASIDENNANAASGPQKIHTKPGGTPVWGSYAYWISKVGYETLLARLQQDVGALLWKGKRGRYYHVKPADKILPRLLMEANLKVQLATYPCFFRAPMLTSKIHTAYDPEFCKSTEYQLQQSGNLSWDDLWLSSDEKEIVQHKQQTGEWITLGKLKEMKES